MKHDTITTDAQLADLCQWLSTTESIAFDTEFVSEHTYRPELCLVQVAAGGRLAVIDTMEKMDLGPFWRLLASGKHKVVVHAGREEVGFSLSAIGVPPANLFDLQVAAGLVGLEYPAGYGSLVQKLMGQTPHKGETRTDWRKRPLTERQIHYALGDVIHLEPMRDRLLARLESLGRLSWLETETAAWLEQVLASYRRDRWRRTSGISGLNARCKAIVRELWLWRESEAERRDLPVRRVLRDDLIVELAKRQVFDPTAIRGIRGLERGDLKGALPAIAECVRLAMQLPDSELPRGRSHKELPPQLNLLGQFIASALGSVCRQENLAASLVGGPSDVRDLIAYRLGYASSDDPPPALAEGWRAEVVGTLIDDLLSGNMAIRIADPRSDHPLVIEASQHGASQKGASQKRPSHSG
ncbi:MAG: HRDC domain-containing protein [Planctomycetia bacterium]|nr:HRDC domain-containing protein [Planctomycetia bacterium]